MRELLTGGSGSATGMTAARPSSTASSARRASQPAATSSRSIVRAARAPPRPPRRLYYAEQVMEARKLPKKKYLATQRLRRDLERSSVESLQLDVRSLQQEIANLRTVRAIVQAQRLTARVDVASSLMAIVAQYHTTMQHGLTDDGAKVAYLHAVLDPHVRVSATSVRSRDALIRQWRLYTRVHALLQLTPAEMHALPANDSGSDVTEGDSTAAALPVIVSHSSVRVRISRETLTYMFPSALSDALLTQLLIGRDVTYPSETRFSFCAATRRIVRHDTELDFVAGLLDVLASLRTVTDVMNHALLDGCAIRETSAMQPLECKGEDAASSRDVASGVEAVEPDAHQAVTRRMSITTLLT